MRVLAPLLLALAACPGPQPYPCVVGDLTQPPELQLVYRDANGAMMPLANGAMVPLTRAPQGGHIMLVSVRVKNAQLCDATLQAALKDPCTGRVAGLEGRPITWTIAADGFAEPQSPMELSDYANLAVCPAANNTREIDGAPWKLEVKLYQSGGASIDQTIDVTPSCDVSSDPESCRCECRFDCTSTVDAGVPSC
ncbi:MAG: hypothetical protein K8W52_20860 [Deltaproteobacteria bacterium]|nr:hypothetical protein [Deltaproteobacteria bacterium]